MTPALAPGHSLTQASRVSGSSRQGADDPASDVAGRMRVLLLISNLEYGGAQRQVVELANRLNAGGIEADVCCLSEYVPLVAALGDAASRLHVVAKRSKFDVTVVPRLRRLIRRLGVNIVHAFLFDAEIAGRLASAFRPEVIVIGSERNTDYTRKWRHTIALRLTGPCLDAIIANSEAGRRFQMRSLGIRPEKLFVVHNGVDVERFRPGNGRSIRASLGIAESAGVVGMFASFKRQKNHMMFFRVARRVLAVRPDCRFLCVGSELHGGLQASDDYREEMRKAVADLGLSDEVLTLGNRDDIAEVYRACDVTVLTSRREGTPNVLLESMACGVPVVATNVADNALIVPDGRAGYVVPLDDDAAMADRVLALLGDAAKRSTMGEHARSWVEREFSLDRLVEKTTLVYRILRQRVAT